LGNEVLLAAKRLKTERRKNSDGTWRMYNLWQAPDGGTFREPVIDTEDDKLRKLNRAERLRSIPPTDVDYKGALWAAQRRRSSEPHAR